MAYQLIRRSSFRPMPWRNGGGTTYEIAREPADGTDFRWRLSLARIDRPGPFSEFRGYRRVIALVSGEGCVLHGAAEAPIVLDRPGATAIFPGEAAVSCELIAGPCHDLNLMVRAPGAVTSAHHLATDADLADFRMSDVSLAVFCLSGALQCLGGGETVTLDLQDTLLVTPSEAGQWRCLPRLPGQSAAIVYAWRA